MRVRVDGVVDSNGVITHHRVEWNRGVVEWSGMEWNGVDKGVEWLMMMMIRVDDDG